MVDVDNSYSSEKSWLSRGFCLNVSVGVIISPSAGPERTWGWNMNCY